MLPDSSVGKESTCNAGDLSLIPRSGRFAGEGKGCPLQHSWAFLVAQLVKNPPAMGTPGFGPWVGKTPWRRERLPTPVFRPGEYHGLCRPWSIGLQSGSRLSDFHLHLLTYNSHPTFICGFPHYQNPSPHLFIY